MGDAYTWCIVSDDQDPVYVFPPFVLVNLPAFYDWYINIAFFYFPLSDPKFCITTLQVVTVYNCAKIICRSAQLAWSKVLAVMKL